MSLFSEFKAFINRGSVVDLAVGVIIGAAFGKIVTSMVEDFIMPPVGKVAGNLDFTNLYIPLSDKVIPGMPLGAASGWAGNCLRRPDSHRHSGADGSAL